jgi:hypothetical protein
MTDQDITYYRRDPLSDDYTPVSYYNSDVLDGVPEGATLIVKQGTLTMRRYDVTPDHASLLAAAMILEHQLTDIVLAASELRPCRDNDPEAQADWQKLVAKHGDQFRTLQGPSANDVANQVVTAILHQAQVNQDNPVIQDLVCDFRNLRTLLEEA